MPSATYRFPSGFLWGTATAAYQVEGSNPNSTWWDWEQQPGRILNNMKSGLACDWWGGRWREDFDRAMETHQNAHRLSVEWSRIQPAPDRWDEDALDVYRSMVRGLVDRGITPLVALHHFSDPVWVAESGGWENPQIASKFAVYAHKVAEALQEYVHLWVTINEPNWLAYGGYLGAMLPPGKQDLMAAFRVMANLVRGHAAAYHAIHAVQRTAQVGVAHSITGMRPAKPWFPPDRLVSGVLDQLFNNLFPRTLLDGRFEAIFVRERIPEAIGTQDFFGLNYYTSRTVTFDLLSALTLFGRVTLPRGVETSPTGLIANTPEGLFAAIKYALRFKVPVIVTENGVEDAADTFRPRYLAQHLHQIWRAINFNYPVKGYFHWTLVDNFEWERGWSQRFGLWELELETQSRRRRPSADFYSEICRENALSSEMVARYAPRVLDLLFPG